MKIIKINEKISTIIDNEDYERINQYNWHLYKQKTNDIIYVISRPKINKKRTCLLLHRFIMNVTDPKIQIDHINGNGLDNRKCNLRIATTQENSRNRNKTKNNTSGYKGVFWHKNNKKFEVYIRVNGKAKYLGSFYDPKEASKVYETKAKELFGEFYREPNEPND